MADYTRIFTDQMNREVKLSFPPKRIISLVPSQTELLYDLGLENEVVGQTLFCIHPENGHKSKTRIGGTKKLKLQVIRSLNPDLIIGNHEENEKNQVEELMLEFPVWMSDIKNLRDALQMIEQLGEITGKTGEALKISERIRTGFIELKELDKPALTCLYFIWQSPWMVAGKSTFIHEMLTELGLVNSAARIEGRYPEITDGNIRQLNPDLIFLSSEPFPFAEKHREELQRLFPKSRVMLVNGEFFSWYGSRLEKSVSYFKELLSKISK